MERRAAAASRAEAVGLSSQAVLADGPSRAPRKTGDVAGALQRILIAERYIGVEGGTEGVNKAAAAGALLVGDIKRETADRTGRVGGGVKTSQALVAKPSARGYRRWSRVIAEIVRLQRATESAVAVARTSGAYVYIALGAVQDLVQRVGVLRETDRASRKVGHRFENAYTQWHAIGVSHSVFPRQF